MSKKEITRADVASFMLAEIHEALLYVEREMEREQDAERKKSEFRNKQIEALRKENEMLRKRAEVNE